MEKLGDLKIVEPPQPQPKKRKRSQPAPAPKIQVTECVREFKLHQTYPSLANQVKASATPVNVTMEKVKVAGAQPIINLKVDSGKIDPTNKIQKLKLKGPDGKDLGEFDIQVLPQANGETLPGKSGATTYSADISSKISRIKVTPSGVAKNGVQSVKYVSKTQDATNGSQNPTHGVLIPISPVVLNQNNQMDQQNGDNSNNANVYVVPSGGAKTREQAKANGNSKVKTVSIRNSKTLPAGMKIQVINARKSGGANVNSLKRQRSNDRVPLIKRRSSETTSSNTSLEDVQVISLDSLEAQEFGNTTCYVIPAGDIPIIQSDDSSNQEKPVTRQSLPAKTALGRVNLLRREKKDTSSTRTECDSTNNPVLNTPSEERSLSPAVDSNTTPDADEDDLVILSEALKRLPDDVLRRKALQVLKNIGIGTERKVPKKPVEQISVKDSDTQTAVFGIIGRDEEEFIKVSEETPGVERITPREHRPVNKTVRRRTIAQNEWADQLNSMLSKFEGDEKFKQIQNVMKFDPVTEKLYALLKNDFENATKYDDCGYLNIHKAVLDENLTAVKRQLMVLKACKVSVDIPTKDGTTSLELAAQESDSVELIRILLNAGANPTSSKKAHDSALTIAAKESLSILPLLIKHARTSGDLNYVDSEGFAAIHYCAFLGNFEGIKALIAADADLNVRDSKSGRTALFHAIENEELEITKELLNNGATPIVPNFSGQTVFHLVDDSKHVSLKELLTKAMKPKTTSNS